MGNWESLRKEVLACTKCQLCKGRKNAVFGEGPKNARIMFIGEAPGAREDELGRPFVGMAGKELTKMLEEVGIRRDEVFITNIVKCRPPENRKPKKEEMNACSAYLKGQIEIVTPEIIATLGNVPLKRAMGNNEIGKVHGKTFEKDGRRHIALYHPAAWLYNRKLRETAKKDFEKLSAL